MPTEQPAARKTDRTEHAGEIVEGSADVLINDLGAARVADLHTCPAATAAGVAHVGGPIAKGSETVFINDRPAARITDVLLCLTPPPEDLPLSLCDLETPASGGYEKKQLGESATNKAFLYGIDAKGTCRLFRLVDEKAKGALGTIGLTVEAVRGEAKLQVGLSNDPVKNKEFAGIDAAVGGALLDARVKYETPQLPIPFTGYGVNLGLDGFGSLIGLEAKATLGVEKKDGKVTFEGGAKLTPGFVGLGGKIRLILAPLKAALEGDLPQDIVRTGSPDVIIGG